MKLRYGKQGWLDLEHMSLTSVVKKGVRVFEPATKKSGRAAVVANRAVRFNFDKAVPSFATMSERREINAAKVDPAVFRDVSGAMRVVYREVIVRFEPASSVKQRKAVLAKFGLAIRKRNQLVGNQIIAYDPKRKYVAERMIELANELTETDAIAFAFPNFVSEFKRTAVPVPVAAQWHLATIDVRKAWQTTQGKGITIAILDDGIDLDHPDLTHNIRRNPDPATPEDLYGRDYYVGEDGGPEHFDPRPKRAAPQAKILPVKIFHANDLATESRIADAMRYSSRFADILSCSWSGSASPDIEAAMSEAGAGRSGKGCPIFCATGNEEALSVAFPARSDFAIAVGASTDKGVRADYSNRGAQVSVVAPSSGGTKGIFTTDVTTPNRGFNLGSVADGGANGRYTNSFGGTSSATPLAAGVAALVLSANPNLTRAEVREVLQETADKIGAKASYNTKGHSRDYGYGQVNAAKAVAKAVALGKAAMSAKKTAKKAVKKKAAKKAGRSKRGRR